MNDWADKKFSNTFINAVAPLIYRYQLNTAVSEQSIILHKNRFSIVINFGTKMLNNSCIIIDKETLKDYDLNAVLLFFQFNQQFSAYQQPGLYSLAGIVKGLNQLSSLAPYIFEGNFDWASPSHFQPEEKNNLFLATIPQQALLYPGVAGNAAVRSRHM